MSGVYGWIRDGVRRAVLLGFSDAVEQLGMPQQNEELNEQLASALLKPAPAQQAALSAGSGKGRRRLGKSLNQLSSPSKQG